MSIAGGIHKAFDRILSVKGRALQVFTSNQRQWRASPLSPKEAALFRERWKRSGGMPVAAHDSYLINLASGDPVIAEKSVAAFTEELRRAAALGIPFLIAHLGSHLGQGIEAGLDRFVRNVDRAIAHAEIDNTMVLLETTAGQGSGLGSRFEELAYILDNSRHGLQMGVCFDTCHAFAAGYDFRTSEAYEQTFSLFDRLIGIERLKFFHLNDSRKELGSKVDRHEHIGKGCIGLAGFRLLLNDPRFQHHPMVLETPKGKKLKEDRRNLRVLRSLISEADSDTKG
jgi:deoxyribonuclease-4